MSRCKACRGTGEIEETPKGGDIVEGCAGRLRGVMGLVVGDTAMKTHQMGRQRLFLSLANGESWSFTDHEVRVVHGHIHINR